MGNVFPPPEKIVVTDKICVSNKGNIFPLVNKQSLNVLNYDSAGGNVTVFTTESINSSTSGKIFPSEDKLLLPKQHGSLLVGRSVFITSKSVCFLHYCRNTINPIATTIIASARWNI